MNFNLQNLELVRILVIGDVMLDRYWHGDTARISPEAPVPVVNIKQLTERPGGASNVALNARSLGAEVTLLGLVGKDEAAITLQNALKREKINCYLQSVSDLPTITKMRVIAHNQQLIRLDFEQGFFNIDMKELLNAYKKQLTNTDIVIISDYGKGIAKATKEIINLAKTKNIPIVVDPKGKDFTIYQDATLITPNFAEFEAIVGPCKNDQEIATKGMQLLLDNNFTAILVTRGAQGMSLIEANKEPLHIPTNVREVYDVTGAGDTVIATLAAALATGQDLPTAVELANIAAGITVRKLGAATISTAELRRAIQKKHNSWLGITNEERLTQDILDAKAHGETIVMTNGCFDVLHAGHIAYLEQAKALGTRLIVAVNDDDSIKRLKGKHRPINSLEQRMAVLAGLRAVDWVVSFAEDNPLRIIKAVTPDILVKGGDWQAHEIIGSDHVIKNGGKVQSLAFIEGHSSSNIINRIREKK
jgi:D-beta-D-heptose 7-phosphate kinase/D-beta-D-heptose 1-phosphate adenosyltransferase